MIPFLNSKNVLFAFALSASLSSSSVFAMDGQEDTPGRWVPCQHSYTNGDAGQADIPLHAKLTNGELAYDFHLIPNEGGAFTLDEVFRVWEGHSGSTEVFKLSVPYRIPRQPQLSDLVDVMTLVEDGEAPVRAEHVVPLQMNDGPIELTPESKFAMLNAPLAPESIVFCQFKFHRSPLLLEDTDTGELRDTLIRNLLADFNQASGT